MYLDIVKELARLLSCWSPTNRWCDGVDELTQPAFFLSIQYLRVE